VILLVAYKQNLVKYVNQFSELAVFRQFVSLDPDHSVGCDALAKLGLSQNPLEKKK